MSVNYNKLWKLLIDKGMKKGDLISVAAISSNIIAKMGRNEYVSMESLEKICISLNCDIGEIVSVEAEVKESEGNSISRNFCPK